MNRRRFLGACVGGIVGGAAVRAEQARIDMPDIRAQLQDALDDSKWHCRPLLTSKSIGSLVYEDSQRSDIINDYVESRGRTCIQVFTSYDIDRVKVWKCRAFFRMLRMPEHGKVIRLLEYGKKIPEYFEGKISSDLDIDRNGVLCLNVMGVAMYGHEGPKCLRLGEWCGVEFRNKSDSDRPEWIVMSNGENP